MVVRKSRAAPRGERTVSGVRRTARGRRRRPARPIRTRTLKSRFYRCPMPVFAYQAVDAFARDVRGTIAADSPREAREKLRRQGLLVEAVAAQRSRTSHGWRLFERRGRHAAEFLAGASSGFH